METAQRLSEEHGRMTVIRLSMLKPTAWTRTDVDQEEVAESALWQRYCVVPTHTMSLIQEARNPKAALLSCGIFDAPITGDDRFNWLRGGSWSKTVSYDAGRMAEAGYDPFDDHTPWSKTDEVA
jgi:hypothetical protein